MQPAAELSRLEPIRDSLQLIEPPEASLMPSIAVIGLSLVLAVALWFLIRWILRRRRSRLESPDRIAMSRLWLIEPDAVEVRELFRELHMILSEYLSARTSVPAMKLTSPEIACAFTAAGLGESPELRAFLAASDRARFSASAAVESTACRESVRQCRAIIDRVEAMRKGGKRRRAI